MRASAYHCIFLLLLTVTSTTDFFLQLMISSSFVTCCLVCFRSGILTEKYENRWMKMYLQVCAFPHSLFLFLVSQSHVIIDHTAHCISLGCWAFHRASVHTPWPPIEPLKMPRALQKTRGSIWVCTCLSIFVTTCLVYALVLIKNKNTLEQYLWCFTRYWPKYQKRLHCSS